MSRKKMSYEEELQAEEDFTGETPFDRSAGQLQFGRARTVLDQEAEDEWTGETPFDRMVGSL